MDIGRRPDFRVIAEGNDAVGRDLTLVQALALADVARRRGQRYVAIVDDSTGAIVDERRARAWTRRGPPPLPGGLLVPCAACEDEGGMPSGDVLVQLPSGTWVRDTCNVCLGRKVVLREELARRSAQVVDESTAGAANAGPRVASGTRPRVARVLVVHQEQVLAEALRLVLSDEFEVKVATDAQQALASMTAGTWYDVVLCEVMMPGLHGVELRQRVHAASPEQAARIVFLGGRVPNERLRTLLESVPNTYLEAPLDVPALRELIRRRTLPGTGELSAAGARR